MAGEDWRETHGGPGFDILSLDQMLADADKASAQERAQFIPRRETDLRDARQVVADELRLKTLGRDLTPAMEQALQRAWLPLMSVILSRQGMNSRPWMIGVELLESLLDLADPPDAKPVSPLTITRGVDRLARALRKVGVPAAAVGKIYSHLLAAFSQSFSSRNASTSLDDQQALKTLRQALDQTRWFEFDCHTDTPIWLKPGSFSDVGHFLSFAKADGSDERSFNVGQLLDLLVAGQVRAVEPPPRAKLLLDELIRHRKSRTGA